jgi:hypothetical protein
MTHLEPIEPAAAVELYLKEKESEVSEWTLYSHGSRLGHFTRWCKEESINNLITGAGSFAEGLEDVQLGVADETHTPGCAIAVHQRRIGSLQYTFEKFNISCARRLIMQSFEFDRDEISYPDVGERDD